MDFRAEGAMLGDFLEKFLFAKRKSLAGDDLESFQEACLANACQMLDPCLRRLSVARMKEKLSFY